MVLLYIYIIYILFFLTIFFSHFQEREFERELGIYESRVHIKVLGARAVSNRINYLVRRFTLKVWSLCPGEIRNSNRP